MNFDEIRREIETMRCEVCGDLFGVADALDLIDTLEREHADFERRLREGVLQRLDSSYTAPYLPDVDPGGYDLAEVYLAHRMLTEILDSSTQSTHSVKESKATE